MANKVDIARRGIIGLKNLLEEAPTGNLPSVRKSPLNSAPLSTGPDIPQPDNLPTDAILNAVADKVNNYSPTRRQFLKQAGSAALPMPKLPLGQLGEITADVAPETVSVSPADILKLFKRREGFWGLPDNYGAVPINKVMQEMLSKKFTPEELNEFSAYTDDVQKRYGISNPKKMINVHEVGYFPGEHGNTMKPEDAESFLKEIYEDPEHAFELRHPVARFVQEFDGEAGELEDSTREMLEELILSKKSPSKYRSQYEYLLGEDFFDDIEYAGRDYTDDLGRP